MTALTQTAAKNMFGDSGNKRLASRARAEEANQSHSPNLSAGSKYNIHTISQTEETSLLLFQLGPRAALKSHSKE